MPPIPKIYTTNQIELLKSCYIDKKMSINQISKNSEKIFGVYIGNNNIQKELKKNDIKQREFNKSISLATRIENYEITYLTEELIEWFDGFLLGDGSIRFSVKDVQKYGILNYARISMGSTQRQWTEYAMSKFQQYQPRKISKHIYRDDDIKHPNPLYTTQTRNHPDAVKQAERWYEFPNCKKIVPKDVRITPTSVMLWYLGDGSIANHKNVKLATCSFTEEEIKGILIPKLEKCGIHTYLGYWREYPYIHVRRNSIGKFFDFIGKKSPIPCYDYKFDYKEFFTYKRICDIAKDKKEKWRAQWLCKNNKVEFIKDKEFNKFFLFTDEQAKKLREKLNEDSKLYFSEEDVQRIIFKYANKESLLSISSSEDLPIRSVRNILRDNSIVLRELSEASRKYNFNEAFFSNGVNNEKTAYLLGYLLADGYNNEKRHCVELSCSIKDKDILDMIKIILDSNHVIKYFKVKNHDYSRMSFVSHKFSQDLAKLGCVQNKSFLINFNDFGKELQNHFIRGFFDGDGCVSYTFAKRDNYFGNSFLSVITFTSTENFCLGLKSYLLDNLGINSTILCRFPERNNCVRTLQISGNIQVQCLRKWMYNNAMVFLNRKYNKFKEIDGLLEERRKEWKKI